MNKWVKRGGVALRVLVIGAGVAFMALVDMGERKLERHVDVSVTPVAFASDAASIERGALPVPLARLRRLPRQATAPATSSSTTAGPATSARPTSRRPPHERRPPRYTPADWVRSDPPRRQARRPAADDHAERGIQPLRRRRPRRGRRLRPPVAAERRREGRDPPADAGEGALRRRRSCAMPARRSTTRWPPRSRCPKA